MLRQLILLVGTVVLFTCTCVADVLQDTCDTGIQDSIIVGSVHVPGPLWPDSIGVPIYIWADEPIAAFAWGLRPLDNRIRVSSFSSAGSVFPTNMFIPTLVDTANNQIGFGWADFTGVNPIDSPHGLVGTVYLSLSPFVSVGESFILDSVSVGPAFRCRLSAVQIPDGSCELRYIIFKGGTTGNLIFGNPYLSADVNYSFDEGSGPILYERTGTGVDGSVQGDPVWITGISGTALKFDGLDDAVQFEEAITSIGNELTISSWATVPANLASWPYFFATSAGGEWGMRVLDDKIACYVTSICGTHYVMTRIPASGWHHFVFSWKKGEAITLFIDGDSITQTQVPDCPLRAMPALPIFGPFQGALDEFSLFHRKLEPVEVLAEYLRMNFVACGDVDASRQINISDAVFIINYIFASGAEPPKPSSADVSCDGRIDITDAVYLINYFFAGGSVPCSQCN